MTDTGNLRIGEAQLPHQLGQILPVDGATKSPGAISSGKGKQQPVWRQRQYCFVRKSPQWIPLAARNATEPAGSNLRRTIA